MRPLPAAVADPLYPGPHPKPTAAELTRVLAVGHTVMHQMIAHHENAVEMSKSLLKFADKDDMFHGPHSKKQVKDLATTIINVQSTQIAEMVLCE